MISDQTAKRFGLHADLFKRGLCSLDLNLRTSVS